MRDAQTRNFKQFAKFLPLLAHLDFYATFKKSKTLKKGFVEGAKIRKMPQTRSKNGSSKSQNRFMAMAQKEMAFFERRFQESFPQKSNTPQIIADLQTQK